MDISVNYGHLTDSWTFGDTGVLLEERCTDSGAGPVRPAGPGVGGLYSSDVHWIVGYLVCARRCTRLVIMPAMP